MNHHHLPCHSPHRRDEKPQRGGLRTLWYTLLERSPRRVHSRCLRRTKKNGKEQENNINNSVTTTRTPTTTPPPECRLLEAAHLFLTLRSQEKWSEMASLCQKDFYFVDLENVCQGESDSICKESDDIEAFISRGRFCTYGLPRVLRNLFSVRAFPAPEVKETLMFCEKDQERKLLKRTTWQFILATGEEITR